MASRYSPAHAEAQQRYRGKIARVSVFLNPDNPDEAKLLEQLRDMQRKNGESLGKTLKQLVLGG